MDTSMISMDQTLAHPNMDGLVSMEAPTGVSVDMDPWAGKDIPEAVTTVP